MVKFQWTSVTPWVRKDVHIVTDVRETIETSPFTELYIQRGDKTHGFLKHFKQRVEVILAGIVRRGRVYATIRPKTPLTVYQAGQIEEGGGG